MIRLTRLSQKASLFVLAAMTVVLIVTAHGIRASSAESSRNNTSFLRSANHALLHSDFEVSMVRAAGEAASFALTRNPTYLHGSAQAVQSAALALDRLRGSLGLSALNDELVSKCVALLERQHQLLRTVEPPVPI